MEECSAARKGKQVLGSKEEKKREKREKKIQKRSRKRKERKRGRNKSAEKLQIDQTR